MCLLIFLQNFPVVMAQVSVNSNAESLITGNLTALFLGLILVLVVFVCIAFVLKRLTGTSANSRGYINVIDSLHISAREKIVLLKVAGTCMVLGVSSGGIKTLHVLDGELAEIDVDPAYDFKSKLSGILSASGLKAG